MCRILIAFEHDELGRVPDAVPAVAEAAEASGAEVRLRSLTAAGVDDVACADALALGIDGRGADLPGEAKQWLDSLGFAGWRHLRGKAGFVFATRARRGDSAAACRMVARILRTRGLETVTPVELDVAAPSDADDAAAIGRAFGRWCMRLDEQALRTNQTGGRSSATGDSLTYVY